MSEPLERDTLFKRMRAKPENKASQRPAGRQSSSPSLLLRRRDAGALAKPHPRTSQQPLFFFGSRRPLLPSPPPPLCPISTTDDHPTPH
jgi:hypothetical protein